MTIDSSSGREDLHYTAGFSARPGGVALTRRALEFCCLAAGSRVIDVGCGAGETLELLEGAGVCRPVGLDRSSALLEEALPKLESAQLVLGRAETLPFKDLLFDAFFCECVLSTLEDGAPALEECARVLRQGGFLILSDVFTKKSHGDRQEAEPLRPPTRAPFVKEDLVAFLERLGFSLLLWEEHERLLKEFAARMILAGIRLPYSWACGQGWETRKKGRAHLSYFLLVGRKNGRPALSCQEGQG